MEALGRSAVVGPGQGAPPGWAGCDRVAVTGLDAETADVLAAAWRERRPRVIELTPGLGVDDPATPPPQAVAGFQPWEWPVDLDLVGERLHHALWANSVDARDAGSAPRWRWGQVAVDLGASPATAGADVTLPDGTPAVCDGGPLDAGLAERAGVAVVHRIWLEHGSLRPIGPADPIGVPLADDQLAAVAEPRAGARIIAPAGSGKTRVLTERARLMLDRWGLPAPATALVAFNVRAAREMQDRLTEFPDVRVRTLNALGLRLGGRRTTIEELDVRRRLSGLVAFPRRAESDPAAPWIEALGRVRLGLAAPSAVEQELPDVSDLDQVARTYRAGLAGDGVVDFDEQIVGAIERLLADAPFRWRAQRFARILLVDEFQDLTPAHLLLIRLLTGPAGAVFGVGDDDQTIYGYAGATPRWLVDFERWFPGTGSHALQVNYRCPAPVVTAAANLLTRNAVRVAKEIRPAPGAAPPVDGALTVLPPDDRPAGRTAGRVRELIEAGASPADVVVLARVNASLAPVQVLLRHDGVPVNGVVDRRFLQRGGVRAALAWLAVAAAPGEALPGASLREAARRPKRGMSASLLDLVAKRQSARGLDGLAKWLEGKGSAREADKVYDLAGDVARVRKAAAGGTAEILAVVRGEIGDGGLDASAAALDRWSHGAIAAHGDDLDALVELAALEPDPERFGVWLGDELGAEAVPGGVTLASIHAVKGREWPHVVVHHASAGLLPHRLADDMEEERRVFHVALTRCRSTATVVPGPRPSPYLAELDAPGEPPPVPPAAARQPTLVPERARPPAAAAAEPLPCLAGARFTHGGHDHEVIEVSADRVSAVVGGGPATTSHPLGTSVTTPAGRPAMLAHPRCDDAFDRLRAWRKERAAQAGVPAYVVFDDKTLRLVAALLPTTEVRLLSITGVGPVKLESYGDDLIALAEQFRSE